MVTTDGAGLAEYWRGFRGRTRCVLQHVPADHIEWRPAPGRSTFGDIARHLGAVERWLFAEYLDAMHAETLATFGALTAEQLEARWSSRKWPSPWCCS